VRVHRQREIADIPGYGGPGAGLAPEAGGALAADNRFKSSAGSHAGSADCEKWATFRVTIAPTDAVTAAAIKMLSS
jgi:hypothetical protein